METRDKLVVTGIRYDLKIPICIRTSTHSRSQYLSDRIIELVLRYFCSFRRIVGLKHNCIQIDAFTHTFRILNSPKCARIVVNDILLRFHAIGAVQRGPHHRTSIGFRRGKVCDTSTSSELLIDSFHFMHVIKYIRVRVSLLFEFMCQRSR